MQLIEKNGVRYISGLKDSKLIEKEQDVNLVMEAAYEKDADRAMLYKENLPAEFTKLGSGQAGMVLHKFMTYRMKLAVVVDKEDTEKGKFAEMVTEVNMHNNLFHVFTDAQSAEEWLVKEN